MENQPTLLTPVVISERVPGALRREADIRCMQPGFSWFGEAQCQAGRKLYSNAKFLPQREMGRKLKGISLEVPLAFVLTNRDYFRMKPRIALWATGFYLSRESIRKSTLLNFQWWETLLTHGVVTKTFRQSGACASPCIVEARLWRSYYDCRRTRGVERYGRE
ncbi:unnamed protein product [Blepharisma stoltei]|uniref:Uncharacterized protein n=1 Tax=Blepharisma stoltei TaxID=1481888 RepID=A0AAU9IMU2_9CILI|nr:unnamed protein product [Blepharisma stoltei]